MGNAQEIEVDPMSDDGDAVPDRRDRDELTDRGSDGVVAYDLSLDGSTQVRLGNAAYYELLQRVIHTATRRDIDWGQVSLAITMDREIRAELTGDSR